MMSTAAYHQQEKFLRVTHMVLRPCGIDFDVCSPFTKFQFGVEYER